MTSPGLKACLTGCSAVVYFLYVNAGGGAFDAFFANEFGGELAECDAQICALYCAEAVDVVHNFLND